MGTDDLKNMFKAAKAQRGGGASLSKEQLKQLRAQKAANAQQAALVEAEKAKAAAAAAAAAESRSKRAAGMPPPAPRAPSGSTAGAVSSKAVNSSLGRPQAAAIHSRPKQADQRSVNAPAEEPATPSGDDDRQTAMSVDSQQAQWRHGNTDKQSTASTSDVTSHRQGARAAAPAQRSVPGSSSALLAADYGSDEEEGASIQGSAATPAHARDGSQSANGLPQGFFEAAGSTAGADSKAGPLGRAERTVSMESAASASIPAATIPKGFFENKEADAKARGQKLPKKPDPKQEYDNFLKSIADDVQEVEARQEVEAIEAAQDKADQEAFEHGLRLKRIEQLRAMSAGPSTAASQTSSPENDTLGAGNLSIGSVSSVVPARKRKRNMSVEVDKADAADSSDDDNDDADGMLDWRAKAI